MKKIILMLVLAICLSVCVFGEKSVSDLNPNFRNLMDQALKGVNSYPNEYRDREKPFSLFFFSDVHGQKKIVSRLMDFYNENTEYFDDALCCGDLVESWSGNDWTYWGQIKGAEKVLLAIGNHDMRPNDKDWTMMPEKQAFDQYFAPYIANWNVKNEAGKTYYFKDYAEKKIRLITVNNNLSGDENNAQLEWFGNMLTDARLKGYTVVAAAHIPPVTYPVTIESNWSEPDRDEGDYRWGEPYCKKVKEFKNDGGKFACWLSGHTHSDYLYVSKLYPEQLCFVIGSATIWGPAYSTNLRIEGTQSADLADAVVIDTTSKTLKAIRIGSHYDRYLRPINALSINYETMKIISEW